MSKLVSRIRSLRASKLGRYIPSNKVLAGALAGAVTLELHTLGVTHLPFPSGAIALGAAVVVGYLLPESPVVAAHVIVKSGPVPIQTITKKVERRLVSPLFLGAMTGLAIPTGDGEPQPVDRTGALIPVPSPPDPAAEVTPTPNAVDNGPLDVVAPTPAPGGSAQVPPAGPGA